MAASFLVTLAVGKRLGKRASWIGIVSIGACFLFALAANVQWNDYVHDSENAGEAEHATDVVSGAEADANDTVIGPLAEGESAAPAAPAAPAVEESDGEGGHADYEIVPITKTWTWFTNG